MKIICASVRRFFKNHLEQHRHIHILSKNLYADLLNAYSKKFFYRHHIFRYWDRKAIISNGLIEANICFKFNYDQPVCLGYKNIDLYSFEIK